MIRCTHYLACISLLFARLALGQGTGVQFVNPSGLAKPTGFSQVVVAPDGRTVYVSGQVPFDSTGRVVTTDFAGQAEQVYRNLQRALAAVGGSMSDLVQTTTYIVDVHNVPTLREVRGRYLDANHPPANTLIPLPALSRPDILIEIQAIAVLRKPAVPHP
jgi:2-iminobutanoate/2-iminopropanoate deaminase